MINNNFNIKYRYYLNLINESEGTPNDPSAKLRRFLEDSSFVVSKNNPDRYNKGTGKDQKSVLIWKETEQAIYYDFDKKEEKLTARRTVKYNDKHANFRYLLFGKQIKNNDKINDINKNINIERQRYDSYIENITTDDKKEILKKLNETAEQINKLYTEKNKLTKKNETFELAEEHKKLEEELNKQ